MNAMAQTAGEEAVWQTIRGMHAAHAAGRELDVEDALHGECTLWDAREPQLIAGRAERDALHVRRARRSQEHGAPAANIVPLRLDFFGAVAVARYYVDFEQQGPGIAPGRIRVTDVLVETHGRWRIVHHHEDASPGAPPSA